MSRIAGLATNSAQNTRPSAWLDQLSYGANWKHHDVSRPDFLARWSGWKAPTVFQSADVIVLLDGMIYNHPGKNGAEVFAKLYKEQGFERAVQSINGVFGLAVKDLKTGALWVARDRVGQRPMYYVKKPEFFAFASRMKALLFLTEVSMEPRREFVALFAGQHYRYFDNRPDKTPFEDLEQLAPGHFIEYRDGKFNLSCYWRLSEQPDYRESEKQLAEKYRDLLLDAVKIRFDAAEKPGFTLSGGMDSSSVLACAVKGSGQKQHAISAVYQDKTYDESDEISSMLDQTVEKWHQIYVNNNPDVFAKVKEMVSIHDEPVGTATWLSHYLLSDEVGKRGFKSLFGGLGGDELNAGEYEYFPYFFADLKTMGLQDQYLHEVKCWSEHHDHPIYRKNLEVAEDYLKRLVDLRHPGKVLYDVHRFSRYIETVDKDFYEMKTAVPLRDCPFTSYLKNRTFNDLTREASPLCMRQEDINGSAFGITNHLPFYDYRIVEFMFRVPSTLKIRDGVMKVLLREAMKGVLPEETRTRIKKTGWNAPAHVWFSGERANRLREMVQSKKFRERGIYNLPLVERIIDEHDEIVSKNLVRENHMMFLWQMVNLELWLETLDEWRAEKRALKL